MTSGDLNDGLHALLQGVIDYAGLFPPARLSMSETVQNYAKFLESDEEWMLGRLIVPARRLEEFEREAAPIMQQWINRHERESASEEPSEQGAWQISALTGDAGSDELANDLETIAEFNERHAHDQGGDGFAVVDVIELKADSARAIDVALDLIPEDLYAFFEIPSKHDPRGFVAAIVDGDAGAKIRTGGLTAESYPLPAEVARFIAACSKAKVTWKATAGMHHPLRHFSDAVQTKEHGFLNIFIAGCLAGAGMVNESEIEQILNVEHINAFTIDKKIVGWTDKRMPIADVRRVREQIASSFGSCSFDEPVADLRTLKLL
ncbi:MAG TPA: hypothetical protein VG711_06840 [Phycisphaerales bacterium]|nr:hypothetical protein [Phycisphaerales bacterium]